MQDLNEKIIIHQVKADDVNQKLNAVLEYEGLLYGIFDAHITEAGEVVYDLGVSKIVDGQAVQIDTTDEHGDTADFLLEFLIQDGEDRAAAAAAAEANA